MQENRVDLALDAYHAVSAVGQVCAENPTEENEARRREIYGTALRLFRTLTPEEMSALPPVARAVVGVIKELYS